MNTKRTFITPVGNYILLAVILVPALLSFLLPILPSVREIPVENSCIMSIRVLWVCVDELGWENKTQSIEEIVTEMNRKDINCAKLQLAEESPYEQFGIYTFNSKYIKIDLSLMYGEVDIHENMHIEDLELTTVFAVSTSVWDESSGKYTSPLKHGSVWAVGAMDRVDLLNCDYPPVPGCYINRLKFDEERNNDAYVYYPESILPAVGAIYPKLEIPEERIIRD